MIEGWLRRITDILFGYDFFISYAHADGKEYPRALRDDLERSGFKVFLDEQEFGGGEELNAATRRRIRMSTKLILLARPRALDTSSWVPRELELFIQTRRDPIILDFDAAIAKAPTDRPIVGLLQNRLSFPESGGSVKPSGTVLKNIVRTFGGLRQETRRTRVLGASAFVFLIIAVVALWQWYEAEVQSRVSDAMALDAFAARHFSEAARIQSVWDRETARLADLEAEAALMSGGPSSTANGELAAMTPAETALRIDNLQREITELFELRNELVNQARSERAAGKSQLFEAHVAWKRAAFLSRSSTASRQAPMPPRLFAIEVLSVGFGESLILHYGDPDSPKFILIDGGQPQTFGKSLEPRLRALRETWYPEKSLPLEYAIVSNQDNDRLGGILKLLENLQGSRGNGAAPWVDIKNLWYESFGPGHAGNAKARARLIAEELRIPLNRPFVSLVTRPTNGTVSLDIGDGMTVTVLNPVLEDTTGLYKWWQKEAIERDKPIPSAPGEGFDGIAGARIDTAAALLENDGCGDQSVANLASHALLFSFGGHTFIHGGDACSWQIENGLRAAGLTAPDGTFKADIMLIPHQGSDRNVNAEFFRRIKADRYLFTGNGTHNNPELATLRMILDARRGEEYWFQFVNRDGKEDFGKKLDAFFTEFPSPEYGYRRVFRSSAKGAMSIDLIDRLRY